MELTSVLTILAILVALLTVIVYLLQIADLAEKRLAQLTNWLKKRKHKHEPPPTTAA